MKKELQAKDLEDVVGGVDVTNRMYGTLVYKEHALGQEKTQITFAPYAAGTTMTDINNYFIEKLRPSGRIFVEFRPATNQNNV